MLQNATGHDCMYVIVMDKVKEDDEQSFFFPVSSGMSDDMNFESNIINSSHRLKAHRE